MAWQLYAQRTVTGEWLHTDVPMSLSMTWALSDPGRASGVVPAALDAAAADGEPMWLERGTTLIAENLADPDAPLWCGLCSYSRPTAAGREIEFTGLSSGFDRMAFLGEIRQWQPDPYDVVRTLVKDGQSQPNGDLGFHVVEDGVAPTYAGDEAPPPRPSKPKRRRGESHEHYDDRILSWQIAVDDWQRLYQDREPYHLAYWDGTYIGEELRGLADEIGFEWYERHRWADRDQLARRSDLVLTSRKRTRNHTEALIEGVNIGEVLDPRTSLDGYANHVIALGAGEGRAMRTAQVGRRDMRIRTTMFLDAKNVSNRKRLQSLAANARRRAVATVTLDGATARNLGSLTLGEEIEVRSRVFTGWCRVSELTRSTTTEDVTLKFEPADRQALT